LNHVESPTHFAATTTLKRTKVRVSSCIYTFRRKKRKKKKMVWLTGRDISVSLTHICPDILLRLNTLMQKASPLLQTVASYKKQHGEILNHLFFQ